MYTPTSTNTCPHTVIQMVDQTKLVNKKDGLTAVFISISLTPSEAEPLSMCFMDTGGIFYPFLLLGYFFLITFISNDLYSHLLYVF